MIKINSPGNFFKTLFLVFLLMNLYSCNRNRNNPGWDYFPDMFYSTAYETNSKNPNFENGMTMRVPVPGTVPRDFTPFEYTNDPESRIKAGKELANPFLMTPETLSRGKSNIYHILHRMPWNSGERGWSSIYERSLSDKTSFAFRRYSF
jgi:hypothetical protein